MTKVQFEAVKKEEAEAIDAIIEMTEMLKDPNRSYRSCMNLTNIIVGMINEMTEYYGRRVDKLEPLEEPKE